MCADQNPNEIKDKRTSRGKEKIDEIEIRYDDDDDASPACCGASPREGDGGGRGDVGSPSMRECRFPRSEFTTATFSPRLAAALAALDVFAVGVRGDPGSTTNNAGSCAPCPPPPIAPAGLDDPDADPSVVSPPLSFSEKSSPSDCASSADAVCATCQRV